MDKRQNRDLISIRVALEGSRQGGRGDTSDRYRASYVYSAEGTLYPLRHLSFRLDLEGAR